MTKQRMKKYIYMVSALLAVLVLASGGSILYEYRKVSASGALPEIVSKSVVKPENAASLGTEISVSCRLRSPWGKAPAELNYKPPEGLKLICPPSVSLKKLGWGSELNEVTLTLCPYRTGKIPGSSIEIISNGVSSPLNVEIPSIEVKELPVKSGELLLAGSIKPGETSKTKNYLIGGALILALLALVLYFFLKRRNAAGRIVLTPWGIALAELCELREKLKNGGLSLPVSVSMLTDIVRNYLEKRFNLNAPAQTTYEFLLDLEKPGSVLSENHRKFLKDFMNASDLVKFANLPAEMDLFNGAAAKAEELICETRPSEEVSGKDKVKK